MPKYVIERAIPGAGSLTADQLKAISQTSCGVLSNMGPQIQWVNTRQNILRVHRTERRDGARTRLAGRFPGKLRCGGNDGY